MAIPRHHRRCPFRSSRALGRAARLATGLAVALAVAPSPARAATGPSVVAEVGKDGAQDTGSAAFALIVGVNRSFDPQLPVLRYADDDAARYQELFRALGARTYLLTRPDENTRRISPQAVAEARDPRRGELDQAVAAMAADVARARARSVRTVFYFIYAGHGNVKGTDAYLALEDGRVTADDIEHAIVDRLHADESHLIVDACYSYFLAYGRGAAGVSREVHGIAPLEGLAHRSDVGLLLSTNAARESHEWEGFQAGVFSHEVRSGLFGAADFNGDGRVSYQEIAAFVGRANASLENERYRPDFLAHAPRVGAQLLDLRKGAHRVLRVDGSSAASHYILEDVRGVRLADFHNEKGHVLSLILPLGAGLIYVRRTSDDGEVEVPAFAEQIRLADLEVRPPRDIVRCGPAHHAFSQTFLLPFDEGALSAYPEAALVAENGGLRFERPAWRTAAGRAALGTAAASTAVGIWLTFSARSLSADAHVALHQQETAALNQRLTDRNRGMAIAYGFGAAAALAGGLLLLWPGDVPVRPYGAVDRDVAFAGLGGRF